MSWTPSPPNPDVLIVPSAPLGVPPLQTVAYPRGREPWDPRLVTPGPPGPPGPPPSFTASGPIGIALREAVVQTAAANVVDRAKAEILPFRRIPVIGFVSAILGPGSYTVQTDGNLGGFVGLVPGRIYFADPNLAGAITPIAPTVPNKVVQKVGQAVDVVTLQINLDDDFVILTP